MTEKEKKEWGKGGEKLRKSFLFICFGFWETESLLKLVEPIQIFSHKPDLGELCMA